MEFKERGDIHNCVNYIEIKWVVLWDCGKCVDVETWSLKFDASKLEDLKLPC